ncbi:MAG TPA: hypothetical protein VFN64_04510 [Burkholderiaceae bacterium]|nr:hypothetical protein [Burkholderiaceae bacterium]
MNAISPVRPARSERPLFVAVAIVVAALIFAGFARTFYLKGLFGAPPLSNLLLAHGVIMTAWVVLFITQIALVSAGRTHLHRRLGIAGGLVAALVVVVNLLAAIDAGRRGFSPSPQVTPVMFMAIPLIDVVVFGSLVGAALWNRRRPATHKRLMLLATLGILPPAVARLPIDVLRSGGLPAFFSVMIFCVVVVVAFDTFRNRRLHPAFGWGAAFLIASVPVRILLAQTEAWSAFATELIR